MENKPVRIVILDHHALVRAGLTLLLESKPMLNVVGEAGNLAEGVELVACLKPDVVLLEFNIAELMSSDIISSIFKAYDKSHIVLVTSTNNPIIIQQAVEEGVMGVIFKTQSPDVLIKAIEKVNAGEVWLERSMIANVLNRLSRNSKPKQKGSEGGNIDDLSEREIQIVRLIGKGYKNKKISMQLCISETTVRHHLTSIYSKLGVSDRLELLVYAHRFGLVKPSNS